MCLVSMRIISFTEDEQLVKKIPGLFVAEDEAVRNRVISIQLAQLIERLVGTEQNHNVAVL